MSSALPTRRIALVILAVAALLGVGAAVAATIPPAAEPDLGRDSVVVTPTVRPTPTTSSSPRPTDLGAQSVTPSVPAAGDDSDDRDDDDGVVSDDPDDRLDDPDDADDVDGPPTSTSAP